MNIKDFEYIAEIAAQESISKAAARLYLSQPTLTKFLKKIEAEFDTPLFYRVGKKMIPTPAGQACVEKARRIIELNDQMNKNVKSLRDKSRGSVRIGTSAGRGEFFIDRILGGNDPALSTGLLYAVPWPQSPASGADGERRAGHRVRQQLDGAALPPVHGYRQGGDGAGGAGWPSLA